MFNLNLLFGRFGLSFLDSIVVVISSMSHYLQSALVLIIIFKTVVKDNKEGLVCHIRQVFILPHSKSLRFNLDKQNLTEKIYKKQRRGVKAYLTLEYL